MQKSEAILGYLPNRRSRALPREYFMYGHFGSGVWTMGSAEREIALGLIALIAFVAGYISRLLAEARMIAILEPALRPSPRRLDRGDASRN
jgi:hypothetical protein